MKGRFSRNTLCDIGLELNAVVAKCAGNRSIDRRPAVRAKDRSGALRCGREMDRLIDLHDGYMVSYGKTGWRYERTGKREKRGGYMSNSPPLELLENWKPPNALKFAAPPKFRLILSPRAQPCRRIKVPTSRKFMKHHSKTGLFHPVFPIHSIHRQSCHFLEPWLPLRAAMLATPISHVIWLHR